MKSKTDKIFTRTINYQLYRRFSLSTNQTSNLKVSRKTTTALSFFTRCVRPIKSVRALIQGAVLVDYEFWRDNLKRRSFFSTRDIQSPTLSEQLRFQTKHQRHKHHCEIELKCYDSIYHYFKVSDPLTVYFLSQFVLPLCWTDFFHDFFRLTGGDRPQTS